MSPARRTTVASLSELVLGDSDVVVGSVCTGYAGLDLGLLAALGRGRVAWVADSDPHVSAILAARMPDVPNLGDVRQIAWADVEPVDVLTAGFPCQDISAAGRRAGIEKGKRSGLWIDIVAAVRVLRPAVVIVENVAALRWRNGGLDRVLGDLAEAGYDALWRSVRAAEVGCAHRRERVFLLAWLRARAAAHAADPAGPRWGQPRRGRSSAPACSGAPSQPARRSELRREVVADTDCRRLAVRGNPDGAQLQPSDTQGLRDSHRLRAVAADSDRDKPERRGGDRQLAGAPRAASVAEGERKWDGHAVVDRREVAADAHGTVRRQCLAAHAAVEQVVAQQCAPSAVDWGEYTAAVRQWELLLGRAAPRPTQQGKSGRPVLAPAFVEHLMGLPEGWISDLPLPRTAQLRALGNGVVPAQAAYAVSLLLADLAALLVGECSSDGKEAA